MTRVLRALMPGMVLVAACGAGDGLQVTDARIGRPTGPNAALYFTIEGGDTDDRLAGARTDTAVSVEIHESAVGDDGIVTMRGLPALEVSSGDTVTLEPGGLHLMLVDAERLETGQTIDIVLVWENAGDMTVVADVVDPSDTFSEP